jgi:hypothetical protein
MRKWGLVGVLTLAALLLGISAGWSEEPAGEGGLDTQGLTGLLGNLGALGLMGGLGGGAPSGGNVTVIIQQPVALVSGSFLFVLYQGRITKYDLQTLAKVAEATYPTEPPPQKTVFAPSTPPKILRPSEGTTPQP